MRGPALAALLAVAACSPGPGAQPSASPSPSPASAAVTGGATGTVSRTAAAGGGLRGEVSALNGEISDLKVTVTTTQTIVELPADILFAFDSADLAPAAAAPLQRTASLIAKGGAGEIRVVGHTDSKGEDAYNIDLSKRRAQAVTARLSADGVDPSRLKADGRGEAEPVAPNEGADGADNPAGRALNRRVVVFIPR